MAGVIRYHTIGFVVGLCVSIGVHSTPSASASTPATGPGVGFYLQGTCLCDTTPTSREALGLADGYLASAGTISGIGYPAGLLFTADAVVGTNAVNAELAAVPSDATVTLAGVSQGAIVLNYVKLSRALQDSHGQTAPHNLRFVTFGDPQNTTGGITTKNPAFQLFAPNVGLPTAYPTTEIVREYDGFSDWPDNPTRLAVLNALMGIAYVHPNYGTPANPTTPGTLKTVSTNAAGGTTTHYVVPTTGLPLTQPLRDAGLNTSLVDAWLRPQIDSAYTHRPQVTSASTPASPESVPTNHPEKAPATRAQTMSASKSTVPKDDSSPAAEAPADTRTRDGSTSRPTSISSTAAVPSARATAPGHTPVDHQPVRASAPVSEAASSSSSSTRTESGKSSAPASPSAPERQLQPKNTPTPTAHGTATATARLSTAAAAGKPDTKASATSKPAGTADEKASKPQTHPEKPKAHPTQEH
ncbi:MULTISPECIES: PE-PPE domain-containing protein [unclassified Mycolicibacterium]|uniref:PE-PPE domain-containing protein n=1 Tax=unclassified Mycolicibacterium TaxID=2636767 RepID=UPI001390AFF3|nr:MULTISPECIES: PE-PPE domain-containing protein [unclassified Mycolicibacterium]MUM08366.1 hypothetical protein [Mycolicibacterium sp. CBMA 213]